MTHAHRGIETDMQTGGKLKLQFCTEKKNKKFIIFFVWTTAYANFQKIGKIFMGNWPACALHNQWEAGF